MSKVKSNTNICHSHCLLGFDSEGPRGGYRHRDDPQRGGASVETNALGKEETSGPHWVIWTILMFVISFL